jgi:hypothetical protein
MAEQQTNQPEEDKPIFYREEDPLPAEVEEVRIRFAVQQEAARFLKLLEASRRGKAAFHRAWEEIFPSSSNEPKATQQ